MNFALAATTLGLVIPAELPDKTFISAIYLSSRYRPLPVWIGTTSALLVQAGIAVLAGRLLELLPHRAVEAVIAALFLGGAAFMIFVPEKREQAKAGELAAAADPTPPSPLRIAASAFGIVALAEFGDVTQILIANLTARYHDPLSVFSGAAAGFAIAAGLGVLVGATLVRRISLTWVRRISGVVLFALAVLSAIDAAK